MMSSRSPAAQPAPFWVRTCTATGPLTAATMMEHDHGISTTVWEVVRLRPAVTEVFADAVRHDAVITVEDLVAGSGLYPDLLAHIAGESGPRPATAQIALPSAFLPWGVREELLTEFGVSAGAVVRSAARLLKLESAIQ